mgnify:CR=1 FL=1
MFEGYRIIYNKTIQFFKTRKFNYKQENKLSITKFINVLYFMKYYSNLKKYKLVNTIGLDISYNYAHTNVYRISINGINKIEGYTNIYFYKYNQINNDGKINNYDTLIGSYHLIIEKTNDSENVHLAKIVYPNKLKIYTKFVSPDNDTIVNRVFNMKINNLQEFTYSPLLLTESRNLVDINNNQVEIIQKYNIKLYDTPEIINTNNIISYKYKFKELGNGINQIFQNIYTDDKLTNSCKLTVENNNKEYSFISSNYLSNDLKIIYTKLDNYLVSTTKNKKLKASRMLNDKSLEKLVNSNILDVENLTLNITVSKINSSKPIYFYKILDNTNIFTLQTNQTYYIDKNNLLIDF